MVDESVTTTSPCAPTGRVRRGLLVGLVGLMTGTALVGGPVYGVAGRRWHADTGRSRLVASALLGAVFVAEEAFTLSVIPDLWRAGSVEVVIGIAVPVLLGRDRGERAAALALLVPLSILGLLVYGLIDRSFLLR